MDYINKICIDIFGCDYSHLSERDKALIFIGGVDIVDSISKRNDIGCALKLALMSIKNEGEKQLYAYSLKARIKEMTDGK
jgi:hypothetical protein